MIVVDTNVIAYLYLPTPYTARAEALLQTDPEWSAPLLWRSELRNALALYLRKSILTLEQAVQIQTEAESLLQGNEYESVSTDVLSLANESNCPAYNCEFIALAKTLNTQLITMDQKLAKAFPEVARLLTNL